MTTSPAVFRLVLMGCALAAFEVDAQVARTTPRSALAGATTSRAAGRPATPAVQYADSAGFTFHPCAHDISSMLICLGGGRAAAAPAAGNEIVSVTVTVRTRRGAATTYTFNAKPVDAIFLTSSALDRFAMPYYIHKVGFDSAAALRQQIRSGRNP